MLPSCKNTLATNHGAFFWYALYCFVNFRGANILDFLFFITNLTFDLFLKEIWRSPAPMTAMPCLLSNGLSRFRPRCHNGAIAQGFDDVAHLGFLNRPIPIEHKCSHHF